MSSTQLYITNTRGRAFVCLPVAIMGIIVNPNSEVLLLAHPNRGGKWEVINGALEAEETILEGILRETREEAGPLLQVRPLGTVHIQTFRYDENVPYMLSVSYLLASLGGEVQPGDDMAGSVARWWPIDEIVQGRCDLILPGQGWIIQRAVELYHLWQDQEVELQPPLIASPLKAPSTPLEARQAVPPPQPAAPDPTQGHKS